MFPNSHSFITFFCYFRGNGRKHYLFGLTFYKFHYLSVRFIYSVVLKRFQVGFGHSDGGVSHCLRYYTWVYLATIGGRCPRMSGGVTAEVGLYAQLLLDDCQMVVELA